MLRKSNFIIFKENKVNIHWVTFEIKLIQKAYISSYQNQVVSKNDHRNYIWNACSWMKLNEEKDFLLIKYCQLN